MTCPACSRWMCDIDDRFLCPACKGELFLPSVTEDIEEIWYRSMQQYSAAMRDERKTSGYLFTSELLM